MEAVIVVAIMSVVAIVCLAALAVDWCRWRPWHDWSRWSEPGDLLSCGWPAQGRACSRCHMVQIRRVDT